MVGSGTEIALHDHGRKTQAAKTDEKFDTALQKAMRCIMLVKGNSNFAEVADLSGIKSQYAAIFRTIFGNQSDKALEFHTLATINQAELLMILRSKSKMQDISKVDEMNYYTRILYNFLNNYCNMEADSIDWL